MTPENISKLKKKFGKILSGIEIIECDDGWFDLIREMLAEVASVSQNVSIRQIKEKWGGLMFFADGILSEEQQVKILDIREKYFFKSWRICEFTGADGASTHYNGGNYKTLCDMAAALLGYWKVPAEDLKKIRLTNPD
jgi:hypothetical protein